MRQERLLPHDPTKRTSSHVAHLRLRSHLSNGVSVSDRSSLALRLFQSASIFCITARILADWPLVLFSSIFHLMLGTAQSVAVPSVRVAIWATSSSPQLCTTPS